MMLLLDAAIIVLACVYLHARRAHRAAHVTPERARMLEAIDRADADAASAVVGTAVVGYRPTTREREERRAAFTDRTAVTP
jgi:hypothetical protein